jgi:hypothetical protein
MNAGMMLRSGLFSLACVMVFASSAAFSELAAQETPAKSGEKKAEKKPAKSADAEAKPKKGQYATEAEAKARCKGTVVWIDKDKFNHYEGSREWGRKPGVFACEQG